MKRTFPVRLALLAGLFLLCCATYSYALDCPAVPREVAELELVTITADGVPVAPLPYGNGTITLSPLTTSSVSLAIPTSQPPVALEAYNAVR